MNELNKISLDNGMLSMLYRSSLVNVEAQKVMVAVKGGLTQEQYEFLMQILNACRLRPEQIEVVNTSDKGVAFEDLVSKLSPQYILSFGAGSGTELFSMRNSGGTKYLNAPALAEMMQTTEESKQLKRKTWGELKILFGL